MFKVLLVVKSKEELGHAAMLPARSVVPSVFYPAAIKPTASSPSPPLSDRLSTPLRLPLGARASRTVQSAPERELYPEWRHLSHGVTLTSRIPMWRLSADKMHYLTFSPSDGAYKQSRVTTQHSTAPGNRLASTREFQLLFIYSLCCCFFYCNRLVFCLFVFLTRFLCFRRKKRIVNFFHLKSLMNSRPRSILSHFSRLYFKSLWLFWMETGHLM